MLNFRFSLSPEALSMTEIRLIIKNSGNENYVKQAILEANSIDENNENGNNLERLLDGLKPHVKTIPIENALAFLSGLFSAYNIIDEKLDQLKNLIWIDDSYRICSLLEKLLLDRTTLNKRSAIISQTIRRASLRLTAIVARQEYWNYCPPHHLQDRSPKPPEKCLMTKPDMEDLRQIFLTKVRAVAEDNSLLRKRNFYVILAIWEQLSDSSQSDEMKLWCLEKLDENDANVEIFAKEFLETFKNKDKNKEEYLIPPIGLPPFFNLDEKLKKRVNEILDVLASEPDSERYKTLSCFKTLLNKHSR